MPTKYPLQRLIVPYALVGGSAGNTFDSGDDYTLKRRGTVTFVAGQTRATIHVLLHDDPNWEPDGTIEFALQPPGNPRVKFGDYARHTVRILNDDPSVQFRLAAATGREAQSPGGIEVVIDRVPAQTVTVDYRTTSDGTAMPGVNYTATSGTLTWEAGDGTAKTLELVVLDDPAVSGGVTVVLELVNPTRGLAVVGNDHTTYRILDDGVFLVGFVYATGSGPESLEYPQAAVAIDRIHVSGEPNVTVDYTVTPLNGAAAGTDYVLANGSLTWTFCSGGCGVVEDLGLQILEDTELDPREGVRITLCNPVNAALVPGKTEFIYTIIDNEQYCTLTVLNDGNGTTTPSGAVQVQAGEPVAIEAFAGLGWKFGKWMVVQGSVTFTKVLYVPKQGVALPSGDATLRACFTLSCGGGNVQVRADAPQAGDGCSWATAFRNVQQALRRRQQIKVSTAFCRCRAYGVVPFTVETTAS